MCVTCFPTLAFLSRKTTTYKAAAHHLSHSQATGNNSSSNNCKGSSSSSSKIINSSSSSNGAAKKEDSMMRGLGSTQAFHLQHLLAPHLHTQRAVATAGPNPNSEALVVGGNQKREGRQV